MASAILSDEKLTETPEEYDEVVSSVNVTLFEEDDYKSRLTPAALSHSPPPEPQAGTGDTTASRTVELRVGQEKQHVGILYGQELWNSVYDCLKQLCPPVTEGGFMCLDQGKACKIEGIWFEGGKNLDKREGGESLILRAYGSHIPPEMDDLRHNMLRMLAGMWKVESETYTNQKLTKLQTSNIFDGGFNVMANVAEFNSVHVDGYIIEAVLEFRRTPVTGRYSCPAAIDGITYFLDDNVRSDFAKAIGINKKDLGSYTACSVPLYFKPLGG
ncbi:hypothetical protein BS50DRAFT_624089 [Corynespora cassiicola Philippines]|uniref:Uncharacterized protein n=1 Tax=Corynespora cassiicola Philippines TaxID=1448308 RepID=A0A2T2ND69_CORCC|nr:hypothetical protein BS50DRAFT_624089 [Corynespora cassiicola Philippines]